MSTIHSFICDLRYQDTTKFSSIINHFLSAYWPYLSSSPKHNHFLISLIIKLLSLDPASHSNFSPPGHDQTTTMNSLRMPTPLLDLLLILEVHLSSVSIICHFLTPQDKGLLLVFSHLDPSTSGDTTDPPFSLKAPPSPPSHPSPLVVFYFFIVFHSSLHG